MGIARRTTLFLMLGLLTATWPQSGRATERRAFEAAAEAFHQGFFGPAEAAFADFRAKYPDSPRVAEALLYQAEALVQLTNYPKATELLATHQGQSGRLADEYLFWQAEAQFRTGEFGRAADLYEQLTRQYPNSARRLEAAIGAAAARARLEQWPQVIEQLRSPQGAFQTALRTNLLNDSVLHGYLLLGKALYRQKDYSAAEAVLEPSGKLTLVPTLAWERANLLSHILVDAGRLQDALYNVTNSLLSHAQASGQVELRAESAAFEASIYERLGQPEKAVVALSSNLPPEMPAERQQQALLKIADLSRAQHQLGAAVQRLEEFLDRYPQAAAADLAWLTLGELRLDQFRASLPPNARSATNGVADTNLLGAADAFNTLISRYPQSPQFGKAQLDLGTCYWYKNQLPESLAAFQSAVERLPFSHDQAAAYFNLGDAQFTLTNYTGAIASYSVIIDKFAALPEVRADLFECTLYQIVRAGLAATNEAVYTNALAKILQWYPNGFYADRAVLQAGQGISRQGNPAGARAIYQNFILRATNATLLPEVQLAVARTYELESNWDQAAREYTTWLDHYSNSPVRPRTEYARAEAYFHGGQDTNALNCFTNFVLHFPTNELAPLAQWWVGDYYFSQGDNRQAELSYQAISLNWPGTDLAYQALLAAGRAAVSRQSWSDAIEYFTNLVSQKTCPVELKAQAFYGYADAQMSMGDLAQTNKNANYDLAIAAFDYLCQQYPTNPVAMLALGGKANCLLQRAKSAEEYQLAFRAYEGVATNALADVVTRSRGKVGMALVLEKQAELETGEQRIALLSSALNHYLDVFNDKEFLRPAEKADPFWTKKSGLEAARLAEALNLWPQAINLYKELQELLPSLGGYLDNKIAQAQKNAQHAKDSATAAR